ncbi:MAG: aldolase [Bryobacterales bacterium]|nr:aldolase [Bryobacterales bacterium]
MLAASLAAGSAGAVQAQAQAQSQEASAWENPVRMALRAGEAVVGATITVASPDVAARAASLGFDFLWIEMEHSPITLETARNMILATRGLPGVPFIRVPFNEIWLAKRALDIGALGVIFPFTSTPELARQAVAACKYPPAGRRGAGPGLATLRWPAPEGYSNFSDRNAMVVTIIEEKQAVENIDAITAVPGIDVVFIGVNDLSYSYGHRGRQDVAEVQDAIRRVVAACRKNNLPVGRPGGATDIPQLREQGFSFFQAASELNLMVAGAAPILSAAGKKTPDMKYRPFY